MNLGPLFHGAAWKWPNELLNLPRETTALKQRGPNAQKWTYSHTEYNILGILNQMKFSLGEFIKASFIITALYFIQILRGNSREDALDDLQMEVM